jgi:hypothetical protein
MEESALGKVLVAAKIENLEDLFNAEKGLLKDEQVPSMVESTSWKCFEPGTLALATAFC